MTNSGALVFNRSDATTVSNAISGTGSVTLAAGTVTLSGANSYGATTVNGGQLIIGNNLTNSGALTVAGGAVSHANCTVSAAGEYIGYMTSGAGLRPKRRDQRRRRHRADRLWPFGRHVHAQRRTE